MHSSSTWLSMADIVYTSTLIRPAHCVKRGGAGREGGVCACSLGENRWRPPGGAENQKQANVATPMRDPSVLVPVRFLLLIITPTFRLLLCAWEQHRISFRQGRGCVFRANSTRLTSRNESFNNSQQALFFPRTHPDSLPREFVNICPGTLDFSTYRSLSLFTHTLINFLFSNVNEIWAQLRELALSADIISILEPISPVISDSKPWYELYRMIR